MGQPNECSCQCGDGNKKYTCYNGFCVEDILGEYDSPTCNGNCPAPTQYACVSGYCIPTVGGAYNNPTCNGNCPPMPTKRYSCVSSTCSQTRGGLYYEPTCSGACPPRSVDYSCSLGNCIQVPGGPWKNDPTCAGYCDPPIEVRYDCNSEGLCVETENGRHVNDPTCGGNCDPSGILYKCQDGQCVQAADGIYLNDPTCSGICPPSSGNYLLVNCQDENETIVATAPSGAYNPPFNGVWKIENECWRMVGTIECPCSPPPITLPDTQTAGCDSCNNGVCCFEVRQCTDTNSYNCVNGECVVDAEGPYIEDPTCGGGINCGQHYWKICVSGLNPALCSSYAGKTIKITPCDDPFTIGDFGPPCSPAPGWMTGCVCCFNIVNSIPEDPEATHHNLVAIYENCTLCNPCATKECSTGYTFDQNLCDCVCLDPPCGGDPPASGACCDVSCDAITCIDGYTLEQCNAIGGTFYLGQNCGSAPCVPETCADNPACCTGFECNGFGQCLPADNYVSYEDCMRTCYQPE